LVRAPDCGSGGRWFESTQLYHHRARHPATHRDAEVSDELVIFARFHAIEATKAFVERAERLIDHPFDVTRAKALPD
jgi:hypothetical protein